MAAAFVRRHGYKVLVRNFKTTGGEIDLVCRDGDALVFVEVKTRAEDDIVRPAEAIDARKEGALREAARRYIELLERKDVRHRFDAVEVRLNAGEIPVCALTPNYFA
ncbi:MAG TPA: YraN family protein [Candidatus Methylacidiphilales bacterium]|nr:YraN family protein [Candidatus Methylacidiphilales bacterium]